MLVRGPKVLLFASLFVLISAMGLFLTFRTAVFHRFAVGVYSLGDTPDIKPARKLWFIDLNRGQPLSPEKKVVVWIEGRSAGTPGLVSIAFFIADDGKMLLAPKPLLKKFNEQGRLVEEVVVPSPKQMSADKTVGVLVMRFASIDPSLIEFLLQKTQNARSQFERVTKMKVLCAQLYGHSEFVMVNTSQEKNSQPAL